MMLEPELMTLMWAGIRGYRAEPKKLGTLTDDELRAITVPTLLITGSRSALIAPKEARDRASHMPHAEVAIVPGSHGGFNRIISPPMAARSLFMIRSYYKETLAILSWR
jgi:pimeloyl-ACP methyl ester carboxylesterase